LDKKTVLSKTTSALMMMLAAATQHPNLAVEINASKLPPTPAVLVKFTQRPLINAAVE